MPRELVIGNGTLLVNFDDGLNMRDLYYPYVGMMNHINGHKNSIGLWLEGNFGWLDESSWTRSLAYQKDTLVTDTVAVHNDWGVQLEMNDAVYFRENIYLKRLLVRNLADRQREFRFFFTHDFSICQTDIGDTALYDPVPGVLLHYKRDRCFLINAFCENDGFGGEFKIFQYATGRKRFGGAEGTWRDAEDGRLEGNPISQGSVDSTVSYRLLIPANGERVFYYWIAVGNSFEEVYELNDLVLHQGPEEMIGETAVYWQSWANKIDRSYADLPPEVVDFFKRSLLVIRTQIDEGGAILASNDSDILQYNRDHYSYVWPRDGALVAYALDKAGYPELTAKFYRFCEKVISTEGFLWHKYNPDGSVGSSWHPWVRNGKAQLPIQEDETALVIFTLWHFYERERDLEFVESLYETLIKPAADFMVKYRDPRTKLPRESYDLWEERRGVFTFTSCAVYGGLVAAARFARLFGHTKTAEKYERAAGEIKDGLLLYLFDPELGRFLRGIYLKEDGEMVKDYTLESSLMGLFEFGAFPANDPRVAATMLAVQQGLWVKTEVGGVARYTNDYYFQKSGDVAVVPGNPWFICTLWLAEWYIEKALTIEEIESAREILVWTVKNALPSGILSEQLNPYTAEPVSVAPLTWSHSTFVLAVMKYVERWNSLKQRVDLVH
ncbi:MAG: glycoside hydrolase family 15 protein, partial [Syntrophothermus sp.]